jgi:hypothetical protein
MYRPHPFLWLIYTLDMILACRTVVRAMAHEEDRCTVLEIIDRLFRPVIKELPIFAKGISIILCVSYNSIANVCQAL